MNKFMKIVFAILVVIAIVGVSIWYITDTPSKSTNHLFFIERSKNKNIVQYDVQQMKNTDLREPNPVVVYWILENGKKEKLNLIQRKYAYGIKSQKKLEKNNFRIILVALKDREIIVKKIKGSYKAVISIEGKDSILEKVYIKSMERSFRKPKVLYIDIFGFDIKTNHPTKERISI